MWAGPYLVPSLRASAPLAFGPHSTRRHSGPPSGPARRLKRLLALSLCSLWVPGALLCVAGVLRGLGAAPRRPPRRLSHSPVRLAIVF